MAVANKKSLDAKAYINHAVANMRARLKNCDEDVKKDLVKVLKEKTASKEYKENLKIVHEDAKWVREYAKRKKGGDITGQEFRDARREFYGRDMEGLLGKDFKKLKPREKVNYIFENFGDTDYSADLIIDLLDSIGKKSLKAAKISGYTNKTTDRMLKENIENALGFYFGTEDHFVRLYGIIIRKFGRGVIAIKLLEYIAELFYGTDKFRDIMGDEMNYGVFQFKITQDTIKYLMGKGGGGEKYIRAMVDGCKDGSINDHDILDLLITGRADNDMSMPYSKVSVEGTKYIMNKILDVYVKEKEGRKGELLWKILFEEERWHAGRGNVCEWRIRENLNLGGNVDKEDYILKFIIKKYKDGEKLDLFLSEIVYHLPMYHNKIADIFIENGDKDLLIKNISQFAGLSKEKKAEIMGDVKTQDELKFSADLEKLREIGKRLGLTIGVKENKEEEKPTVDEELKMKNGEVLTGDDVKKLVYGRVIDERDGMDWNIENPEELKKEYDNYLEKIDSLMNNSKLSLFERCLERKKLNMEFQKIRERFFHGDAQKKPEGKGRRRLPRFRKGV